MPLLHCGVHANAKVSHRRKIILVQRERSLLQNSWAALRGSQICVHGYEFTEEYILPADEVHLWASDGSRSVYFFVRYK